MRRGKRSSSEIVARAIDIGWGVGLDAAALTERWSYRRKAAVIETIKAGLMTVEEAAAKYELSLEEIAEWKRLYEKFGARGLHATKLQAYRNLEKWMEK